MPIRIDTPQLLFALDDHSPEVTHYLDRETGEVIAAVDDAFDEDDEEYAEQEALRDTSRYLPVEPVPSHQGWSWMSDFVDALPPAEDEARRRLEAALGRDRPFRRFKDALHDFPALREAWFRYHEERLLEHAREWLASEGVEAELADLFGPAAEGGSPA